MPEYGPKGPKFTFTPRNQGSLRGLADRARPLPPSTGISGPEKGGIYSQMFSGLIPNVDFNRI